MNPTSEILVENKLDVLKDSCPDLCAKFVFPSLLPTLLKSFCPVCQKENQPLGKSFDPFRDANKETLCIGISQYL
jgi:hypothetical protein